MTNNLQGRSQDEISCQGSFRLHATNNVDWFRTVSVNFDLDFKQTTLFVDLWKKLFEYCLKQFRSGWRFTFQQAYFFITSCFLFELQTQTWPILIKLTWHLIFEFNMKKYTNTRWRCCQFISLCFLFLLEYKKQISFEGDIYQIHFLKSCQWQSQFSSPFVLEAYFCGCWFLWCYKPCH